MAKEECFYHTGHEARIKKTEDDIVNIYALIEKVRNRLPVWATVCFAILTGIIGWLLKGL